jgi:hypothetical protein
MTKKEINILKMINSIESSLFLGWLFLIMFLIISKLIWAFGAFIINFVSHGLFWTTLGWMILGLVGVWILIKVEILIRKLWLTKE